MEPRGQDNLFDLFLERLQQTPDGLAYRQYRNGAWVDFTWAEAAHEVGRFRAALLREGLVAGERVGICLRNGLEWVLFDQAALSLGLVTVPLYFDDRAENMAFCLNDAGCRLLIFENPAHWEGLCDQLLPELTRAVCFVPVAGDVRVRSLADWLPAEPAALMRAPAAPEAIATIVYTSGTTGRPKGVMLSHQNILSNVAASLRAVPVYPSDRLLSFLPLSHMLERTCGYYLGILAGAQTVYSRGIPELANDLHSQRPTAMIAVPRFFERLASGLYAAMPAGSVRRRLLEWAAAVGWRHIRGEATHADRLFWPLLYWIVARPLAGRLGGRLRVVVVGGAAFPEESARTFVGLGLPILQGYGLTESAPVLTANRIGDRDPLSVGRAVEGVELRLNDDGELLARGPNIMLGYWNNPEATRASIDAEGWLHTGDLARVEAGRVYIVGRLKDIIVLSNGEKVPPADAEAAILRDPVFEQVLVVGEGRPRLGLLCASPMADEVELCRRANRQLHDFPGYVRIRRVARVSGGWTVENGTMTPTLKLKRAEILRRHSADIERMYATTGTGAPEAGQC